MLQHIAKAKTKLHDTREASSGFLFHYHDPNPKIVVSAFSEWNGLSVSVLSPSTWNLVMLVMAKQKLT